MGSIWPYQQPSANVTFSYPPLTEAQVRQIIREELQQALHPEQSRPSVTLECTFMDGQRYKGTLYLVEEDAGRE